MSRAIGETEKTKLGGRALGQHRRDESQQSQKSDKASPPDFRLFCISSSSLRTAQIPVSSLD